MPRKPKPANAEKKDTSKHARRPVTPEVLQKIATMALKGRPNTEIARKVGVVEATIRHHLNNTIRPMWHDEMRSRLHEDLAKVALIERTAWERFESSTPGETQETIEKALLEGGSRPRVVREVLRKITKTGEVAWIQVIQWCIEFRAKIHAHYAPTRHHIDHGGELRVAGMSPAEVDQAMLQRLAEQIMARRKHAAAIEAGRN